MRIVLVGAVESSAAALTAMAAVGHPPAGLVTLPASRRARHSDYVDLRPLAASLGVPVIEAADINAPEARSAVAALQPSYLFVIGWSQIVREPARALAAAGCLGYHPTRLPAMRGRAVIPWTILAGVPETAGTLFWLDDGVDSGPIAAQEVFPVPADATARSLYDRHLVALGAMLRDLVPKLARGERPATPQDESAASYCARRTADDGAIDWHHPAAGVDRLVRAAGAPYPGAFTVVRGARLTIWDGAVQPLRSHLAAMGQVVEWQDEAPVVLCGDGSGFRLGAVSLGAEAPRPAGEVIRMHDRLGVTPGGLAHHLAGERQ
ncbi:MAG: methionyl-tRNA formyltransferase [Gemmatimonadales bacterium]